MLVLLFIFLTFSPIILVRPIKNINKASKNHTLPTDHIIFYLYTPEKSQVPHRIDPNDPNSLTVAGYNEKYPLKILCHGLSRSYLADPGVVATLKAAYFACGRQKMNIIGIDWTSHSSPGPFSLNSNLTHQFNTNYGRVVKYAETVGRVTGKLIDRLVRLGTKIDQIHLVGFSLGSHCMGFAGHFYKEKFGKKVGRITALDPSGLCFDWEMPLLSQFLPKLTCPPIRLMSQSDAEFVDVLHTAANFNGMTRHFGHVDFQINGGYIQPNCGDGVTDTLTSCSHRRVLTIFAESICNDRAFESRRDCWVIGTNYSSSCDPTESIIYMGEYVGHGVRGIFSTPTNPRPPFSKIGTSFLPSGDQTFMIL